MKVSEHSSTRTALTASVIRGQNQRTSARNTLRRYAKHFTYPKRNKKMPDQAPQTLDGFELQDDGTVTSAAPDAHIDKGTGFTHHDDRDCCPCLCCRDVEVSETADEQGEDEQHNTELGWCCACEADIAFLHGEIEDAREQARQEAIKDGFYAGQSNAGVSLEQCHKNWKKWDTAPTEGEKHG
jgi:hypothetical protein